VRPAPGALVRWLLPPRELARTAAGALVARLPASLRRHGSLLARAVAASQELARAASRCRARLLAMLARAAALAALVRAAALACRTR
jgi:hypothetical protein